MEKSGKRRLISVSLVILLFLVMLIVVLKFYEKSDNVEPEYVLSYATVQSGGHPTVKAATEFARLVGEATGDRIRIVVKTDGELGTESDVVRQMQCGGIDMGAVSVSTLTSINKELYILEMPYLFRNEEHLFSVLDSEFGTNMLSSLEGSGLIGLGWIHTGERGFFTVEPLNPENLDYSERNYRVPDTELFHDMLEKLDATSETIDLERVYSALENGDIFGADGTIYNYNLSAYSDVAPYYYIDSHSMAPEMMVFSDITWKKLSLNDKKILFECAKEAGIIEREALVEENEAIIANLLENGASVEQISDEQKNKFYYIMTNVYYEYVEEYIDTVRDIYLNY